jgi:hypothetical protein
MLCCVFGPARTQRSSLDLEAIDLEILPQISVYFFINPMIAFTHNGHFLVNFTKLPLLNAIFTHKLLTMNPFMNVMHLAHPSR